MIKINKIRSKIAILILLIAVTYTVGLSATVFAADPVTCPAGQTVNATGGCTNDYQTINELNTGADCELRDDPSTVANDPKYITPTGEKCTSSADCKDGKTSEGDACKERVCGKGGEDNKNEVQVSFDFGCIGKNYSGENLSPIVDIIFAIFRFLSAGVGIVVVGSIIVAGIQYSAARGNPQATQNAIKRITNALIGLLIFIFLFAIANFLVPGGMFL